MPRKPIVLSDVCVVTVIVLISSAVVAFFLPWLPTSVFQDRYVEAPERVETAMYYLTAVRERGGCGAYYGALENVPREMRTWRVCLEAIKQCDLPSTIKNCPSASINHEVALVAANSSQMDLRHIPEAIIDDEVAMTFAKSGGSLYQVPERLRTRELYLASVAAMPRNIVWVSKEKLDNELVWLAVRAEPLLLEDIPEGFITAKLCRLAVSRDWRALTHVPFKLQTEELYRLALEQSGEALERVPFERRSLELCRLALAKGNGAWDFVPKHYFLPDAKGRPSALAEFLARR